MLFHIETEDGIKSYDASELPIDKFTILVFASWDEDEFRRVFGMLSHGRVCIFGIEEDQNVKLDKVEEMRIESIRDKQGRRTHTVEMMWRQKETGHFYDFEWNIITENKNDYEKVEVWKLIKEL